jgi:pimeloyl-ACP methyl ester carboxylesterase
MTYHHLETKEGDRFYREAGAGEPIVLLHCSSGSSGAWTPVMNHLGQDYRLLAPDLLGYGRTAPWPRDASLGADAELGVVEALLDVACRPAHLVGHSYGGTVALNAARRFPRQVASLTLIEPVAFHLLRRADEPDGWREIAALAERHLALVGEGRNAAAAEAFVTYWTGPKAWQQMPDAARDNAVRTAAKVAAEWRLMFAAEDDRDAIAGVGAPTLLICGGRTRMPARRVVEVLRRTLPHALPHEIADAGHMSPLTHASEVSALIVRHIVDAAADVQRRRWRPQSLADIPGAAARRAEAAS